MESNCMIIGIGGATCAGKTTIANELHAKIPESIVIHQDDYYYPIGSPNLEYIEEVGHYNWDVISAINTDKLINEIHSVIQKTKNQSIILIIEGSLILNILKIREICSCKYYLTLPYEICKTRRYNKKYEIPDSPLNFDKIVWPQYVKYNSEVSYNDVTSIDTSKSSVQQILNIIFNDLSKTQNLSFRIL